MRPGRPGQEFRMRLGRDEERMLGLWQFHELDEPSIRRKTGTDQARRLERRTVVVVDLVAVPVPLMYDLGTVQPPDQAAFGEYGRIEAEPHRAAHVAFAGYDIFLVGHRGDDRIGRVRIELRAVGAGQASLFPAK